jgi:dephospho-CoA kinase
MIKVALTGNFKSGHREIADIFIQKNTPVFDADLMMKYLLNFNKKMILKIKQNFGPNTYTYGLINFNKFEDTKKFNKLIDIIQPELFSKYENFRQKNYKFPYTIFLSSILFERGWNDKMNYTITTFNPQMLRRKSLINQTQMPNDMIDFILDNEYCEFIKNSKSNFVLHNYGEENSKKKIESEIIQIHSNIVRHCIDLDYHKTFLEI